MTELDSLTKKSTSYEEIDDFDDVPVGSASVFSTIFNLTNTIIGSGLLAVPLAFQYSGYIGGTVLLLLAWILSAFAMYQLTVVCIKTKLWTYKELSDKVGGKFVSVLVQLSVFCYCTGTCITYPIFLGGFIPHIFSIFFPNTILVDRHLNILIMSFCVIYPISMFKNLSALKYTSFLALICVVYTTLAIVIEFFTTYFDNYSTNPPTLFNFNVSFFRGFPYMTCAFTAHFNVLRFYLELKNRSLTKMTIAATSSTFISFIAYFTIGIFGYFSISPNVTGNILVDYPSDDYPMVVACLLFCIVMSVSFPLVHHAQREICDNLIFLNWTESTTRRISLSLILISVCLFLAVAVEEIGVVLGYNGSIFGVLIVYIFPSYLCFKIQEKWNVMSIVSLFIMALGFALMVLGVVLTALNQFKYFDD
ncbi:Amino acid transporter [Entamoeba marina]